jgi:hypothetical protein
LPLFLANFLIFYLLNPSLTSATNLKLVRYNNNMPPKLSKLKPREGDLVVWETRLTPRSHHPDVGIVYSGTVAEVFSDKTIRVNLNHPCNHEQAELLLNTDTVQVAIKASERKRRC